jgi:hypothetical protein
MDMANDENAVDLVLHLQVLRVLRLGPADALGSGAPRLMRLLADDGGQPPRSLLAAFEQLHERILRCSAGTALDILTLEAALEPFLQLLGNDDVSWQVVDLAVDCLRALLVEADILRHLRERPRQIALFRHILRSITQCRFAPSDASHDEMALLKTCHLTRLLSLNALFSASLNDRGALDVLESLLAVVYLPRFSDQLRLGAEHSLLTVVDVLMHAFADQPALSSSADLLPMDCFGSRSTPIDESPSTDNVALGRTPVASLLRYLAGVLTGPLPGLSDKRRDRTRASTLYLLELVLGRHGPQLIRDPVIQASVLGDDVWRHLLLVFAIINS